MRWQLKPGRTSCDQAKQSPEDDIDLYLDISFEQT